MENNPEKKADILPEVQVEKVMDQWFSKEGILEKHVLTLKEQESRKRLEEDVLKWKQNIPNASDDQDGEEENLAETQLQEKVKKLLLVAQKRGLMKSIDLAKKSNDPYLIDLYHDILCKDDLYLKF